MACALLSGESILSSQPSFVLDTLYLYFETLLYLDITTQDSATPGRQK